LGSYARRSHLFEDRICVIRDSITQRGLGGRGPGVRHALSVCSITSMSKLRIEGKCTFFHEASRFHVSDCGGSDINLTALPSRKCRTYVDYCSVRHTWLKNLSS